MYCRIYPASLRINYSAQSFVVVVLLAQVLSLLSFVYSADDAAGQESSRWQVYPTEVHVSADYPARVVVVESLADGSSLDRTVEVFEQLLTRAHECLTVESNGTIRLRPDALHENLRSPTQLGLQLDGWETLVTVNITNPESVAPIFLREVSALLGKSGCNLGTCHGNLHGKGRFRLSLRGDDPELDYTAIVRADAGRRVNSLSAELSLLLRKPAGLVAHQGGIRFMIGSTEYELLKRWIDAGCRWTADSDTPTDADAGKIANAAQLTRLDVFPSQILLAPQRKQQQLVVIATFEDGSIRDVTRWARFDTSLASDVTISPEGLVTAEKPLDVSVSVSYLSGRTAARLTFLPSEQIQWRESPAESRIDQLVEEQLQRMRVLPQPIADDNVFLRRVFLVVAGRLPSVAETREYLTQQRIDKREQLIERLLHDSGYASLWALRWSDLLRNEQKVMSQFGAEAWHGWMVDQVGNDRPLTEFVAEMLTTVGSTYEHPPASFHRSHREPETAAESIGQVFLGVRLQCTRCHNHPFDKWRQDDYYGLAAYFTSIERKQLDNAPKDKFDKHIISGDEIISISRKPPRMLHPGRTSEVPPKPLTDSYGSELGAGESRDATEGQQALESLAAWLTNDNRLFARNMANRVWFHLLGRGIVDPPDDFRDSNPPSNPELLNYLTDELMRSNYSIRHLSRLILQSRTFSRAAAEDGQLAGLDAGAMFAGYPLRRMSAEVLYDALSDVTQVFAKLKDDTATTFFDMRATSRALVPTGSGFMATFGKPNRLLACECERSDAVSLGQSLVLVNGTDMLEKLGSSTNRLTQLLSESQDIRLSIEQLYLATLTRLPQPLEIAAMTDYVSQAADKRLALEDVLWALINSQEFALIR